MTHHASGEDRATGVQIVRWQLKCLKQSANECTERELDLLISFEEQFERNGALTDRQMKVLEDIYKRRT